MAWAPRADRTGVEMGEGENPRALSHLDKETSGEAWHGTYWGKGCPRGLSRGFQAELPLESGLVVGWHRTQAVDQALGWHPGVPI